jgi:hypothetical protein
MSRKAKLQTDGWSEEGPEMLEIRNWRTKAMDRDVWRCILESAKTLQVLLRLGVSQQVLVNIDEDFTP